MAAGAAPKADQTAEDRWTQQCCVCCGCWPAAVAAGVYVSGVGVELGAKPLPVINSVIDLLNMT